jgi:glycosyltransferase involved in cell wall biosynthesis
MNIVILGASCFDGMATSQRVKNLMLPLVQNGKIRVANLIYEKDTEAKISKKGRINEISYQIIGYKLRNIFSVFSFYSTGIHFLRTNKIAGQKNIIYNYSYLDIQNLIFIWYGKLIGYKIIFDIVEDNNTYSYFPTFIYWLRNASSKVFLRLIPVFADSIIAISSHLVLKMKSLTKKTTVHLIPITVNLSYFPTSHQSSPEYPLFKIFYGGSFGTKDGFEYLIKSFEKINQVHPNTQLVLTGKGMDHDMLRVEELINHSDLKNNIFYAGYLETDEYYALLNECHIFCMTRINSKLANAGFPFKLGEFLATGKAVIATDIGDVTQYLENKRNALVIKPNSVEELVSAFSYLIENPHMIDKLGKEGRETVEKYFDTYKISLNLFKLLQGIK